MLKKVLKGLGIFLLVTIIALAAAPFLFKDKIKEMIAKTLNENVNANIAFEDVDLSLFKSFPQAHVTIDKLSIINKAPFAGDTLLYAGETNVTMSVKELFKGEGVSYTIEKRQIVLNKVSSQPQDNKQPVKVTGKVVDESGEVLPGVTVMIEGATQGTITGIDGNYQLQVPEGSTLKFTSIGYTTYTQKITRPMTLNVTMKEDSKQLDEVVTHHQHQH